MFKYEKLRSDLLSLDPKEFYMKHIVKSQNWYFSDYLKFPQEEIIDKMDDFKEIVSTGLNINFHNVQIVGSAKVGYSLSPYKLFSPFHEESDIKSSSDIDIAIISDRMYNEFWNALRKVKQIRYINKYYKHLTESIFRGYINEKDLTKIDGLREKWENMVQSINLMLQDNLGFIHPITYRIYRNWDDLEEYQIIGITKARKSLEEN